MLHRHRQRALARRFVHFIVKSCWLDSWASFACVDVTHQANSFHENKLLLLCGNMNDSLFLCSAPLWIRAAMRWCVDEICSGYLYISFRCFPPLFFCVSWCRQRTIAATSSLRSKYYEAMENYESLKAHRVKSQTRHALLSLSTEIWKKERE